MYPQSSRISSLGSSQNLARLKWYLDRTIKHQPNVMYILRSLPCRSQAVSLLRQRKILIIGENGLAPIAQP